MTLDVYARLRPRVKREHGRAFDTLVRQAREQFYGTTSELPEAAPEPNLGHESGHEATLGGSDGPRDGRFGEQEAADLQADPAMARPGFAPVWTAFPVVGMDAVPRADGDTRTRTGDTTIFRRACQALESDENSCLQTG